MLSIDVLLATLVLGVLGDDPRKSEDRIIGGEDAVGVNKLPFMSVFNFKPSSSVKCTASLISPSWLISAAHCLVAKKHFTDLPCLSNIDLGLDVRCHQENNGDIVVKFFSQVSIIDSWLQT